LSEKGISERMANLGYAGEEMAVKSEHAQEMLQRGKVCKGWKGQNG
jgi:hypothetical protein